MIEILPGTSNAPPHTYKTEKGTFCHTDRWFFECGLCFDTEKQPKERGGLEDPYFYLSGPNFRCYYPSMGANEFKSCMTSGSSGRWAHANGIHKNGISYVNF